MATITPSSVVAEAKGKIGNQVYSRNAYGAYVKAHVVPTNPNTARQQDWRARMADAVTTWQNLPLSEKLWYQAQADQRNAHSRVGKWQKITAYNLFIRHYLLQTKSGGGGIVGNPVGIMNNKYQLLSVALDVTTFEITVNGIASPGETYMTIKAGAARGSGRLSFNPSTIILIEEALQPTGIPETIDITTAYVAQHGAIAGLAGQLVTIGIQTFNANSGERTQNFFLTGEVQP